MGRKERNMVENEMALDLSGNEQGTEMDYKNSRLRDLFVLFVRINFQIFSKLLFFRISRKSFQRFLDTSIILRRNSEKRKKKSFFWKILIQKLKFPPLYTPIVFLIRSFRTIKKTHAEKKKEKAFYRNERKRRIVFRFFISSVINHTRKVSI